jgi:hypothetical protein
MQIVEDMRQIVQNCLRELVMDRLSTLLTHLASMPAFQAAFCGTAAYDAITGPGHLHLSGWRTVAQGAISRVRK